MIVVAGANGWPLVPTLLIGAAVQTVFRIIRRTWSNALVVENASEGDDNRFRTYVLKDALNNRAWETAIPEPPTEFGGIQ